jgi:hypothetical protein
MLNQRMLCRAFRPPKLQKIEKVTTSDRSVVERLFSFCPSDLTALKKSHHPPLVIPTRISCHAALDRAACAPFRRERRMKCVNATNLNRKSGGAQPRDLRCAPAPAQRSHGLSPGPKTRNKHLAMQGAYIHILVSPTGKSSADG